MRTALTLILLAGCSSVDRDQQGYERDLPGAWFAGDVHVHATGASNDTDGESFPNDIAAMAKSRGLDFVVLTDHSNSAGSDASTRDEDPALFNQGPESVYWEEAAALSTPDFVMASGSEISPVAVNQEGPTGHIGCLPRDLETFDPNAPFIDRPRGTVTGKDVLDQANRRGCFSIVNHPFGQVVWIRYDWSSFEYDALEVWNGGLGLDPADFEAWDAWRCDLIKGRQVTPIGASDNHKSSFEAPGRLLNPALGYPSTSVFAASRAWPDIIEGLDAGRVAIHEGESFLQIDAYDAERRHGDIEATRFIRLRGHLDSNVTQAILQLQRADACEEGASRTGPPEVVSFVEYDGGVRSGMDFDREVEITKPGVYTATLIPQSGEHYGALSGAIVVPGF